MNKLSPESRRAVEALAASTGGTYVFNGETAISGMHVLLGLAKEAGIDIRDREQLREGLWTLFRVEAVNQPDFNSARYILAPNHVSDLDGVLLGLLHPNIRIVAKKEWAENEALRRYTSPFFNLRGLDRKSMASLRALIRDAVKYFTVDDGIRHYLVFGQGTISDFNRNTTARISPIAQSVSVKTGVPVVTVFLEQVSLDAPARIVFSDPVLYKKEDNFAALWLEQEASLQASVTPPARRPILTQKHANNNKPGDPFFDP